jgi:hypothetical protein
MATDSELFGASAPITVSPASLASSTTLAAGRASTAVDNSTNLYVDALLSGKIRVGTTPTANTIIAIYVWAQTDDTPTYPDSITGSDAAFSPSSAGIIPAYLKLAVALAVDSATTGRDYTFSGISVAQLFGGILPQRWGVWITHNTAVNLDATAGNHVIKYQGVKYTVA